MSLRDTRHFDEKDNDVLPSHVVKDHSSLHDKTPSTTRHEHHDKHDGTLFSSQHHTDKHKSTDHHNVSHHEGSSSEPSTAVHDKPLTVPVERKYEPYEIKISSKDNAAAKEHEALDEISKDMHKLSLNQDASSPSSSSTEHLPSHPRTFTPINISAQPGPLNKTTPLDDRNRFKPRSANYVHDIQKMLQRIINKNHHQPAKSYHLKKLDKNQLIQELIKHKKLRVPKEVEVKKYNHRFGDYGSTKVKRMGAGKYNYGTHQDDIREALDYIEGEKELARIQEEQRYLIAQKRLRRPTVSKKRRGSVESAIYGLEHPSSTSKKATHAKPSRRKAVENDESPASPIHIGRIASDNNDETKSPTQNVKATQPAASDSAWVNVVKQSTHSQTKSTTEDPDLTGEPLNDPSVSPIHNMSSALTQVASKISSEVMNWISPSQTEPSPQ